MSIVRPQIPTIGPNPQQDLIDKENVSQIAILILKNVCEDKELMTQLLITNTEVAVDNVFRVAESFIKRAKKVQL